MSNLMETVRRDLQEKVGVFPSDHWLTDCWQALSLERNHVAADDVLQQILHHDLRDVVRTFDSSSRHDNESLPSVQLRHAIRQSQQASHQFKAHLPGSFSLLVQMEEVLDVSVNAMTRLEHGPTGVNSSPTPTGNQAKRCLKIAYTDGYNATGQPTFDDENQPPHEIFVSMELQPIADLSVHCLAGLKIIIKGPLQVRHGVALWHAGNTTIIGGSVTTLVEMQHQAIQQAKRLAGVGVDPTVRALIGTQPLDEEEENVDEGEHESGDVPSPPPPQDAPQRAPPPPATVNPMPPPPPSATWNANLPISRNPYVSQNAAGNPYTSASGISTSRSSQEHQPINNTNSSTERSSSFPRGESLSPIRQHGVFSPGSGTATICSSSSQKTSTTSTARGVANPYTRLPNPIASSNAVQGGSRPSDAVVVEDDTGVSPVTATSVPMEVEDTDTPRILFCELWRELESLIQSPGSFRQAMNREWIVEMQQYGTRVDFNIISQKKKDGGKKKEYVYLLLFKFGAPADSSRLVTCQVHTNMVETYMGHAPADLRKLRKSKGTESQRICKEGGNRLRSRIAIPRTYRVTLAELPNDYWQRLQPRPVDGREPILHIREL